MNQKDKETVFVDKFSNHSMIMFSSLKIEMRFWVIEINEKKEEKDKSIRMDKKR